MREPTLEETIELARKAHAGQFDRVREPYFNHLERVASLCLHPKIQKLAYLHDIIEDTELSEDDLARLGYGPLTLLHLRALTKKPDELYLDYINRASSYSFSALVKLADLYDHLTRLDRLPAATRARLRWKYETAWYWIVEEKPCLVANFLKKNGLVSPIEEVIDELPSIVQKRKAHRTI